MSIPDIAFAGHGIDRADHLRADPAGLAEARNRPDARLLALDGIAPVLGEGDVLVWRDLSGVEAGAELVLLGLQGGVPLFAPVPAAGDLRPAFEQRPAWEMMQLLGAQELALYGGARSVVDWHARHRFCANCGAPTLLAKGGWQRNCTSCDAQHFPRVDPVAIMLVEHEGRVLLGRGLNYPDRLYSALAGFIEPGESIEEAVAREVFEEAGVRVRDVSYIASQPWPFPSQLMLGCHAYADDPALAIDATEIADARWFTREEVAEAIASGDGEGAAFRPPLGRAIASYLLRLWLAR